jgi:hypothetical protein
MVKMSTKPLDIPEKKIRFDIQKSNKAVFWNLVIPSIYTAIFFKLC